VSKALKKKKIPDSLKLDEEQQELEKLFNIMALISFLVLITVIGGAYIISGMDTKLLYTRSVFIVILYSAVVCGLSYAMSHFIRENPYTQVSFFKKWMGGLIIFTTIMIISLGLFY